MRIKVLLIFSILLFTACQKTETQPASANVERYALKGKVVSVEREKKTAKIDHDEIPGYMPAMTMDFPIHEDWIWDNLTPGSEIRAELVVDNTAKDPYYLEKVGIVALPNPDQPAVPINEKFAQIGKPVPDFQLTNQDGKRFTFKDYRGKALAITFIYGECPLPYACIKMSTNFSDLAHDIALNEEFQDKMRLLSISFDPARDTPEKLRAYGRGYLGNDVKPDFTVWQLAVGSDKEVRSVADFFGLQYSVDENDKTQINHSLRTAVISPEGKVTKIFAGNVWTPDELLRELKAAIK